VAGPPPDSAGFGEVPDDGHVHAPDYFRSEWGALEHHSMLFRHPANAQRRFLPRLIKDCQPPDIIAQFAYIDWRPDSGSTIHQEQR